MTSLHPGTVVFPYDVLEFSVQSTHPQPDSVSLALLNPPPGCVFTQIAPGTPPVKGSAGKGYVTARGTCRWLVSWNSAGFHRLTFRATDHTHPSSTLVTSVELRVDQPYPDSPFNTKTLIGDVTGDGVLDTVVGARSADVAGIVGAGAIYVWNGATAPSATPSATLVISGATAWDGLTGAIGQAIQLADVTGDGVLDVIAGAKDADVAGTIDAGAIYVWKGGPSLTGTPAPKATLTVPGASPGDRLGYASGQSIQLADVTGDGLLDVVGSTYFASVGGTTSVGAIYVWRGGSSLVGSVAPTATLTVPGAAQGFLLGYVGGHMGSSGQGIQLIDVTGDGVLDVVAGTVYAAIAGVANTGAIYVWKGGITLRGTPALLATLQVPGAAIDDYLGLVDGESGIKFEDVTGDRVVDVVAGACHADVGGKADAGAIYVWAGGPTLSGPIAPLATLTVAGALQQDQLGKYSLLELADVTADGLVDVIVGACETDLGALSNVGAIYLWAGGATLLGSPAALATLTVPGARAGDRLGLGGTHGALWAVDVTGDGVRDVIAGAPSADVAGNNDAGAIYVWTGGSTLGGAVAPSATLTVSGAHARDLLGISSGEGIQLADVTGDGFLDVVANAWQANTNGQFDVGAIYVWAGGPALSGSLTQLATLSVTGARPADALGYMQASFSQGVQLADVTGDGLLDLVAGAFAADVAGTRDVGAIYVWQGGATLNGSVAPLATLTVPNAVLGDGLGYIAGNGILLADVTGDDLLDIVAGTIIATVAGVPGTGAVYAWSGGITLTGPRSPDATLTVSGAVTLDFLGNASGQGLALADVTGDGVLDVVAGTAYANVAGIVDTGACYQWMGGATLAGSPPVLQWLSVPGATAYDWLGN